MVESAITNCRKFGRPGPHPITPMKSTESCIKACNKLLRGEISAIETYNQALEKFSGSSPGEALRSILGDHEDSADQLREHIFAMGGVPDASSGVWGRFATAVEGAAGLIGGTSALQALIGGEEHGRDEYEEALEDPELMEEAKAAIRASLLPRQIEHVSILEDLRAAV
jgi:bacterioferritin (cytochrome b1)